MSGISFWKGIGEAAALAFVGTPECSTDFLLSKDRNAPLMQLLKYVLMLSHLLHWQHYQASSCHLLKMNSDFCFLRMVTMILHCGCISSPRRTRPCGVVLHIVISKIKWGGDWLTCWHYILSNTRSIVITWQWCSLPDRKFEKMAPFSKAATGFTHKLVPFLFLLAVIQGW